MDNSKLIKLFNKDITDAQLYACKKIVESFPLQLQELFDYYLENEKYPAFDYKGWSFKAIEEHTHYDVFEVYMEMNKLMTDNKYFELFAYMSFGIK